MTTQTRHPLTNGIFIDLQNSTGSSDRQAFSQQFGSQSISRFQSSNSCIRCSTTRPNQVTAFPTPQTGRTTMVAIWTQCACTCRLPIVQTLGERCNNLCNSTS